MIKFAGEPVGGKSASTEPGGEIPGLWRVEEKSNLTRRRQSFRGTFGDGSPAVVVNFPDKGQTLYCAFLPGLSYFAPAIPLKPLDRGSTDDAMAHFIPTEFDENVGSLIGAKTVGIVLTVKFSPAPASSKRRLSNREQGTDLPVCNWSGRPVNGLMLTVNIPAPTRKVELAGGGKVQMKPEAGKVRLTFDLDVAETVILR